jgi:hypothetical protein
MTATATASRKIKRDKPVEEWGKFMGRLFRAYARKAAAEDPWVVLDMMQSQRDLQAAIDRSVLSLIKRGYTYETIGGELGMSKQSVSQRWGKTWREMSQAERDGIPA